MTTKDLVQKLIDLGVQIANAAATQTQPGQPFDWRAFLQSPSFAAIQGTIQSALNTFTQRDFDDAIAELQAKKTELLNGRQVTDLVGAEFDQVAAVNGALLVLTARNIRVALDADVVSWLAENALPTLQQVAPVLLPLLLAI